MWSGSNAKPAEGDCTDGPKCVTGLKIKVSHAEITGNLCPNTLDPELSVCAVEEVGALSAADNIPGVVGHSVWLTDYGVNTAAVLVIKRTGGYGIVTGGAAADVGNPDRGNGWPLAPIDLVFGHYGSKPREAPGLKGFPGNTVPVTCVWAEGSCDSGFLSVLPNVPSPS